MRHIPLLPALSAALLLCGTASAQLPPAGPSGITMGHYHLKVRDVAAQKKFWTEMMDATPIKLGTIEVMKLPDVLIFLDKGTPSGGTKGTSVNHIGFKVRDVKALVAKMKEAGVPIVTRTEVSKNQASGDYWYNPPQKALQAFVMAPEDLKLELTEDPTMTVPVMHHHIHFYTPDLKATQAWYVKNFDAVPGMRGQFVAADLPGANLSFTDSAGPVVGTKGHTLDHIGFDVKDLEAFCKKLEASGIKLDSPYRKIPSLGISIAFLTDPWGTYIELTEGLNRL